MFPPAMPRIILGNAAEFNEQSTLDLKEKKVEVIDGDIFESKIRNGSNISGEMPRVLTSFKKRA
jgi:hypothetical protein